MENKYKKYHFFFRCVLIVFFIIIPLKGFSTNVTLLWDYDMLMEIKNNPKYASIVEDCIDKANRFLDLPPLTVMDKNWSFNEDYHNYASMAGYWWPEEINGKIVYVNHDGKSNPAANDLDLKKIKKLAERLQYLSLAYYFTHEKKYHQTYKKLIDTWFIDKDTYMYPNFEYAQVVPGSNKDNKGRAVGLIEAHPFNTVLESIRLISSEKSIGRGRLKKLKTWFSDFAEWMVESDLGKRDRKANSNQAVSYDVTLLNIADFIDYPELKNEIIAEFAKKRIEVQIESDGKMPAELARTNAFSYSLANLNFFAQFCIISKSLGVDIYSENKERFDRAIDYLYQYIENHSAFPYKQENGWKDAKKNYGVVVGRFYRVNRNTGKAFSLKKDVSIKSIDDLFFL